MKVTNKRHFAFLAGLLGTVQIICLKSDTVETVLVISFNAIVVVDIILVILIKSCFLLVPIQCEAKVCFEVLF